jgi:hypothetical protein
MNRSLLKTLAVASLFLLAGAADRSQAQGTGVPVYARPVAAENALRAAAEKLRLAGQVTGDAVLTNQLNRKTCDLKLPPANTAHLSGRELWAVARAAHLRVGWYYLCSKCGEHHLNLAAGYAINSNGVIATCYHVAAPPDTMKNGFIVVADEDGNLFPVTEILAANRAKDVCLLRVAGGKFQPLPLQTEIFPGDRCVCFSDPLGERGYFSEGIVSRFLSPRPVRSGTNAFPATRAPREPATRLNVTTDWAPGSSGAAVLDDCGNAIGHVTAISTLSDHSARDSKTPEGPTLITLHEAVSARDVLALIHKE